MVGPPLIASLRHCVYSWVKTGILPSLEIVNMNQNILGNLTSDFICRDDTNFHNSQVHCSGVIQW